MKSLRRSQEKALQDPRESLGRAKKTPRETGVL